MKKILACGFFWALCSSQSLAGVIYSNVTDFRAQLNSIVFDDYSNDAYEFIQSNAVMSAVLGETQYQSTGFNDLNVVTRGGTYCAGCNGSFALNFESTSVSNGGGVYGFGFDFLNGGDTLYSALVTYADDTTELFALPRSFAFNDGSFDSFFGVTSTIGVRLVNIGIDGLSDVREGYFELDNLLIGNTQIPEPSIFILFLAGLLGSMRLSRK
ncbi:hypothetical protein [Aliiglaciecola sp. M165]|uniref:hypothetical protein n=1 Tax=Aliiglaciecola sp. M165 TaxID=2593649 RepID=UPI00117D9B86|nr:hypothetical protein [Aliiglaciecola sp. M165]TRY31486.1 hypothetical protein FM019_11480 [Aliiglaciecola sp. M165]